MAGEHYNVVWDNQPLGQQDPQTILDYVKSYLEVPRETVAGAIDEAGYPKTAEAVRSGARAVGNALLSPPVIGAGLGAMVGGPVGAMVGGAAGQSGQVLYNWLTGKPVPSPQAFLSDLSLGTVSNAVGMGGARGTRSLPEVADRVLPGRFAAAEARNAGVTSVLNATGQAAEASTNQATKQGLLNLARPSGTAPALYAAADAAASTAAPLTSLPLTSRTVTELLGSLPDKNPVYAVAQRIDQALGQPSGLTVQQVVQEMRELARLRRPEAERLYGSLRQDLSQDPVGQMVVAASQAFKEDLGRKQLGQVVGAAAPVDAPVNVSALARLFQKNQGSLEARLPASELGQARALVQAAQTRPGFTPEPITPGRLEGPGATEWRAISNLLSLAGGASALGSGHSYGLAGLLPPTLEMLPPMLRAYRAVGPNPPWANAVGAMTGGAVIPDLYRRVFAGPYGQ